MKYTARRTGHTGLHKSNSNDYRKFWNKIHKTDYGGATKFSDTTVCLICDQAIEERRRDHFEKLYNLTNEWLSACLDTDDHLATKVSEN